MDNEGVVDSNKGKTLEFEQLDHPPYSPYQVASVFERRDRGIAGAYKIKITCRKVFWLPSYYVLINLKVEKIIFMETRQY